MTLPVVSTSISLALVAALNALPLLAQFPSLWPEFRKHNPVSYGFVLEHLTMTPAGVSRRPYTMITYMFHHLDWEHFMSNMLSLIFHGLLRVPLGWNTLIVFFGGGFFAAAAALYEPTYREQEWARPFWIRDASSASSSSSVLKGDVDSVGGWFGSIWNHSASSSSSVTEDSIGNRGVWSSVWSTAKSSVSHVLEMSATAINGALATAGIDAAAIAIPSSSSSSSPSSLSNTIVGTISSVKSRISETAASWWEPVAKAANNEIARNRMHIGMSGAVFAFMGVQAAITTLKLARMLRIWWSYEDASVETRSDFIFSSRRSGNTSSSSSAWPWSLMSSTSSSSSSSSSHGGGRYPGRGYQLSSQQPSPEEMIAMDTPLISMPFAQRDHHHHPQRNIDMSAIAQQGAEVVQSTLSFTGFAFQFFGLCTDLFAATDAAVMALGRGRIPSPLAQIFGSEGISHAGHFGGFVFGYLYGLIVYRRVLFRR